MEKLVQKSPGIRSHQERCGLKPNSFRPALLWFSSEQVFHALALGFCFLFFLCLEQAQCTKFCMIFCLQLQTFQKLNLSARARRLLLAPGAKTAPEAAQESPAQRWGTSLTRCSAAGDKVGMEPEAGAHLRAGSVSEQVPAVKEKFAASSSEMKAASGATFPQELPC